MLFLVLDQKNYVMCHPELNEGSRRKFSEILRQSLRMTPVKTGLARY